MKPTQFMFWLMPFLVLSLVCNFTTTATAQNYYPSEIGNTWVFLSADGAEQRTYTLEKPENIDNEELIVLKISTGVLGGDPSDIDRYFVSAHDGGLLLHQSVTDEGAFGIAEATFDPPVTFFPALLPVGHAWEILSETVLQLAGPATSTSAIEVVAIEDVETPAGTFKDCVKIEIRRRSVTALIVVRSTSYQWLAPDVGPVKYQDDQDIVYELESYSLVEAPTADEVPTVEDAPAVEEPAAEEPDAEEAAEEPAAEEPDAEEETPAEEVAPEEPTPEEPMPEPVVEGPGFDVTLEAGLNMISIPLMPAEPYTAKSLAEMLGATAVIQLDAATQHFVGYTIADEGDGFGITGDKGYIVNTPSGGMVKFTGDAWDNQPEPEEAPAEEPVAEEETPRRGRSC